MPGVDTRSQNAVEVTPRREMLVWGWKYKERCCSCRSLATKPGFSVRLRPGIDVAGRQQAVVPTGKIGNVELEAND